MEIQLNFSEKEIQLIMAGLAELPFKIVYPLINKIDKEVNIQLSTKNESSDV